MLNFKMPLIWSLVIPVQLWTVTFETATVFKNLTVQGENLHIWFLAAAKSEINNPRRINMGFYNSFQHYTATAG